MPKTVLNSFRNNLSLAGLTLRHDSWMDQPVLTSSDVKFNTILVGNLVATGDVRFAGRTSEVFTEHLLIKDNIIDINTGNTAPLLNGGIRVQRGPGLQPFDILYNEEEKRLKIGYADEPLQAVATRQDNPLDGGLAVWNAGANRFDSVYTLVRPMRVIAPLTIMDKVVFNKDETVSAAPSIGGLTNGNLILDAVKDIVLGNDAPPLAGTDPVVKMPKGRALSFSATNRIFVNNNDELVLQSPKLYFPPTTRIGWGNVAAVYSINGGTDLVLDGSIISVNPQTVFKVQSAVPINHADIGSFRPINGSYEIISVGDLVLNPGTAKHVIVPNLSVGKKLLISADTQNGNVSLDSVGDLFLNPAANVVVNSGKSLTFSDDAVSIRRDISNNLVLKTPGAVLFDGGAGIGFASTPEKPFLIGAGTKIYEHGNDTVINSAANIFLYPAEGSEIRVKSPIAFSLNENITSNNTDLVLTSGNKVSISAPLGLFVEKGIPVQLGDANHRIYQNNENNVVIDSTHQIVLNPVETVSIPSRGLTVGGATISENSDGCLVLSSSDATPGSTVNIVNDLLLVKDTEATENGTGSIITPGGVYIGKSAFVNNLSTFAKGAVFSNVVRVGDGVTPIVVTNASETNGTAMNITSRWDETGGYSIGRGSPNVIGGRALQFTVPSFNTYGLGTHPSFVFSDDKHNPYMVLDSLTLTLPEVDLKIFNTSDTAVVISGGITVEKGLTVVGDFTAAGFSASNEEIKITPTLTALNGFTVYGDNGNGPGQDKLFSTDVTGGHDFLLDATFNSKTTFIAEAVFKEAVTASAGLTLGDSLDLANHRVLNLKRPELPDDPVTKQYADDIANGLSVKLAADAATGEEMDFTTPLYNLDDVILTPGSRVLVKNQTDPVENGIYVITVDNLLERSSDMTEGDNVSGTFLFVIGGTLNGNVGYVIVGPQIVVGTDPIVWTAFSGASMISVGAGLHKEGNLFFVKVDNETIVVDSNNNLSMSTAMFSNIGLTGGTVADPLATSSNQNHVTALGTITTGTWNADVLEIGYGGTGVTELPYGELLLGNGVDGITSTSQLYLDGEKGMVGINNSSPRSELHIVNTSSSISGTVLRLEDITPVLSQTSGLVVANITDEASLVLRADGALFIGQDTIGDSSKIIFGTQQLNRLSVEATGNVVVGDGDSETNSILTVLGDTSCKGTLSVAENIVTPFVTFRSDGTDNVVIDSPLVSTSGSLYVPADTYLGNLSVVSSVEGETSLISSDPVTGLSIPLLLRNDTQSVAAICQNERLIIPGDLQIGGIVGDTASGFGLSFKNNNLLFSPGRLGQSIQFNAPLSFGEGLALSDKLRPNDPISLRVNSSVLYVKSAAGTLPESSVFGLQIGGGTNEMVVSLVNKSGSASIKYDPTDISEYTGGTLTITDNVLSTFNAEVRLMDILRFGSGNSSTGILGNTGWYYLGELGIGRTTLTASLSWRIRINYDGVSAYTITTLIYDRNVASLVIYQSPGSVYHIFIHVISGPVKLEILESPTKFFFTNYEGGGATPVGTSSGYVPEWVKDYDLVAAQSNATIEVGSLAVSTDATFNSARFNGEAVINGNLTVKGSKSSFSSILTEFINPSGNGVMADVQKDEYNNSTFTVYGDNSDSPAVVIDRGLVSSYVSMVPSTSAMYAGAMILGHTSMDPSSQIVLSTKETPRMVVDSLGKVSLLSTMDSVDTDTVALSVAGGATFGKKVLFRDDITAAALTLRHGSGINTIISSDNLGNVNFNGVRLSNIGDPVLPTDAVNRMFVEGLVQGLSVKESVYAASDNRNYDLSAPLTVMDGITLRDGSRVLVKDQINPVENGIYVSRSGVAPSRAADLPTQARAAAVFVFIGQGTANSNTGWVCSTPGGEDIVGVNALYFTQFSGAGQFNAGAGLGKVGNTIQVLVDGSSIEVVNNYLRVKSSIAGQGLTGGSGEPLSVSSIEHLSTVGVITAGQWAADVIGTKYGGTGSMGFPLGRIPFSNGVSLTGGRLYFDESNVRLGINTLTPTSGLTVADRDIELNQSTATPSYMLFTSSVTNHSFSIRNDATKLVIASGTGANKLALVDSVSLDSTGVLTVNAGISTAALSLGGTTRAIAGTKGIILEKTASGAFSMDIFSSDNTGAVANFFGGVGRSTNVTNSEFMRTGYFNGQYIVQTSASGTGVARSLVLQAGTATNQVTLYPNGNIYLNGPVTFTDTTDTGSGAEGSLAVLGGVAINKGMKAANIIVTSTSDTAAVVAGGLSAGKLVVDGAIQKYSFSSDTLGNVSLINSRVNSDSILQLTNLDGNNSNNSFLRIFGKGHTATSTSEYLQMGYEKGSAYYSIRTVQGGAASQRAIVLSATANLNQIVLTSDGGTVISGGLTVGGTFSISSTIDATSFTSGGSLTLGGGLGVAKTIMVGKEVAAPVVSVTDYTTYSMAGSLDKIQVKYTSVGNLHFYNNSNTALNVHTGNSLGPTSANQEKLVLGYGDQNTNIIHSFASGNGVVRDLELRVGGNAGQMKLLTTGHITTSGNLTVGKSLLAMDDSTMQKALNVNGQVTIGTQQTGKLLTINGLAPWAVVSVDATKTRISPLLFNSTLAFTNQTEKELFSLDSVSDKISCGVQTAVSTNSVKAFSVQNSAKTDMFIFDTVSHTFDLTGGRIVNVSMPTMGTDAATKAYVDTYLKGLNLKQAVKVASTGNVDLAGVTVMDDINLYLGDRVLLMHQLNPVENGIYEVGVANILLRPDDFEIGSHVAGAFCFVQMGTLRGDKGYSCIADPPNDVVNTNALVWTQFNGNIISAGLGLFKDGNNIMNISLDTIGSGLSFNGTRLRVDPSIAGSGLEFVNGAINLLPVTKLGTVITGRWQGASIETAFGGTGNATYAPNAFLYYDGLKFNSFSGLTITGDNVLLASETATIPTVLKDGMATRNKDVSLYGEKVGLYFGSFEYSPQWKLQKQTGTTFSSIGSLAANTWTQAASSKDGEVTLILAQPDKPIYLSTDRGVNFDQIFNDNLTHVWGEAVISFDGTTILLSASEDYLYISRDKGITFIPTFTDFPRFWEWTSISDNGQYMMASSFGDGMFTSRDRGVTWTSIDNVPTDVVDLGFVHTSKDGAIQFAGYYGAGGLFVSRDYGVTFTKDTIIPDGDWYDISEAQNSNVIVLFGNPGIMYVSRNMGATWVAAMSDAPRAWISVSISGDGSVISAAVENGLVYMSRNFGVSWTTIFGTTPSPWSFVGVSTDGLVTVGGGRSMPIYSTSDYGVTTKAVSTRNITATSAAFNGDDSILVPDLNGLVYRYYFVPTTNLVIGSGKSTGKDAVKDFVVFSDRKQVGIGYTSATSDNMIATLSVKGSLHVTDTVQFVEPVSVSSGGTGLSSVATGLLYKDPAKSTLSSTGLLPNGGVPIGKADGSVAIESGDVFRSHVGLAIGRDVQGFSANLDAISALSPTNNYFIMGNGTTFVMATASAASESMGLGDLAYLDTVNNTNWSGTPLSVVNGGTGITGTFATGGLPFFNGTSFAASNLIYDSTNDGLVVNGGTTAVAGSALTAVAKDISLVNNVGGTLSSLNFLASDRTYNWRLRNTTGNALILSGGVGAVDKNALTNVATFSTTGEVTLHGATESTTVATGAFRVVGGAGIAKNLFVGGTVNITSTTEASSTGPAGALIVAGGISVAKRVIASGLTSTVGTFTATTEASSVLVASVTVAGGLGVAGKIYSGNGIVVETAAGIGSFARGLSIGILSATAFTANAAIADTARIASFANSATGGSVVVNMRNTTATNGWDLIAEGGGANRFVLQSAPVAGAAGTTWFTLHSTTGTATILSTEDGTSGTGAALHVAGGISCAKSIQSGGLSVLNNVAGTVFSSLQNTNAGDSAATLRILNSSSATNGLQMTLNSGARTTEGGANAATIRNNLGILRLQSSSSIGLTVETTGAVTMGNTADAVSIADGGSATVKGGMAVAKSLIVGGNVTVTGTMNVPGAVTSPTITASALDYVNVTTLTVKGSRLVLVNNECMLSVTFRVTPTATSLNTQFTFTLPNRTTSFVERLDLDFGQASGFVDDVNMVVLENMLCTGVPASTKAVVKFQSASTAVHFVQVFVKYSGQ